MVEDAGLEPAYVLAYPLSQSPKYVLLFLSLSFEKSANLSAG